jgi:hypothetical protein
VIAIHMALPENNPLPWRKLHGQVAPETHFRTGPRHVESQDPFASRVDRPSCPGRRSATRAARLVIDRARFPNRQRGTSETTKIQ